MGPRQRILNQVVRRYTNLAWRDRRHRRAERWRWLRGAPRRVLYFHQVDDPYSALTVQVLERLERAYDIELVPHLVGAPDEGMIASKHRDKYPGWVRKDAADIAPAFGLDFVDPGAAPSSDHVGLAQRILAGATPEVFLQVAPAVTRAVWSGDSDGLQEIARRVVPVSAEAARRRIEGDERTRRRLGYVYGGTFYYGGEWFLTVDRVQYLEERLCAQGARTLEGTDSVVARPTESLAPCDASAVTLEFFPSVRSPYSYVAMERTAALAQRTGVQLVCRPVLPIIMRGGYRGRFGQMIYVYADSAREAERYGVGPFDVCECVYGPVERGYSLFPWADAQGRGIEYLHAFTRGVFAQRVDAATDAGMQQIVENAGLSWAEASPLLGSEDWREPVGENLRELYGMGLWGVPSFRVSGGVDAPAGSTPFATWGADRLWLVEAEIMRRCDDRPARV